MVKIDLRAAVLASLAMLMGTGAGILPEQTAPASQMLTASAEKVGTYELMNYIKYEDHVEILYRRDASVEEVIIPDTIEGLPVTSISDGAFSSCESLASVTIPDSVTSIGGYAFAECASLTSITIPDSVTSIDDRAFSGCASLTDVTIPESVTYIGGKAFDETPWLDAQLEGEPFAIVNNILFDSNEELCTGEIVIPKSVTCIGEAAVAYCDNLTSVTIPESVTSIENSAFSGCASLTDVTISESVTYIGGWAFGDTPWLYAQLEDKPFVIVNNILLASDVEGEIVIPESVTTIAPGAFGYCFDLTSVTIPEGVATIGIGTFEYCESLTTVTIPDSVTSIGESAFWGCEVLTDVYYSGTEEEWNAVEIEELDNGYFLNATIHFNSTAPDQPDTTEPDTSGSDTSVTVWGDTDDSGDLSIVDVIVLNKYLMLGESLTPQGEANADVDQNGTVNATDSLNILKAVVKIIELPVV